MIDRAVVLTLPERDDRRRDLDRRLSPLELDVHREDAVDGRGEVVPECWPVSAGAYGCRASHLKMLRAAQADQVESLLVLEDDVSFTSPAANERLQHLLDELELRDPDWDMLMLGGSHQVAPDPGAVLDRCRLTTLTHAMLISQRAYGKLISLAESFHGHIDHAFGYGMLTGVVTAYAPKRWLARQSGSPSSITVMDASSVFYIPAGPFEPPNHLTGQPGRTSTTFE